MRRDFFFDARDCPDSSRIQPPPGVPVVCSGFSFKCSVFSVFSGPVLWRCSAYLYSDTVEATQVAPEQSLPDLKLAALKTANLVLEKYYRMFVTRQEWVN